MQRTAWTGENPNKWAESPFTRATEVKEELKLFEKEVANERANHNVQWHCFRKGHLQGQPKQVLWPRDHQHWSLPTKNKQSKKEKGKSMKTPFLASRVTISTETFTLLKAAAIKILGARWHPPGICNFWMRNETRKKKKNKKCFKISRKKGNARKTERRKQRTKAISQEKTNKERRTNKKKAVTSL